MIALRAMLGRGVVVFGMVLTPLCLVIRVRKHCAAPAGAVNHRSHQEL
jgi:hypothetical protein